MTAGLALCLFCSSAGTRAQSTVFTTGPINGTLTGWAINGNFGVADSFTLSQPATIGNVTFGSWLATGDTLTSVNWAIASSPFGSTLASGTALNPTSTFITTAISGHFSVYSETFSISSVSLSPGTYYFEMQNAQTPGGQDGFWDENNGPNSTAALYENGSFYESIGAESFTLSTPVPEPGVLALACLGPVLMLLVRRKK